MWVESTKNEEERKSVEKNGNLRPSRDERPASLTVRVQDI
jgi:hypothetical protein